MINKSIDIVLAGILSIPCVSSCGSFGMAIGSHKAGTPYADCKNSIRTAPGYKPRFRSEFTVAAIFEQEKEANE
jgi:hypothetical protein